MQRAVYVIFGLFAAILLIGLLLPRFVRVELDTTADAPPSVVFAQAESLERMALWAPFDEDDSTARVAFAEPARGEGASVSWNGTVVGSGSLQIVESIPYQYVSYLLNPGEPGEAVSWIELEANPNGTRIVRGFEHDYGYNLVGRYFGLLWRGVLERDYGQSLERLKTLVESLPRTDFAGLDVDERTVEAREIVYSSTSAEPGADAVSAALGQAYLRILASLGGMGLRESGAPLAVLRGYDGSKRLFDAAIPVRGVTPATTVAAGAGVQLGKTYAGRTVVARHVGAYEGLSETHHQLRAYLAAYGLKRNGMPWEVYLSDPGKTPEAELITEIYYPVSLTLN
ncbi:MAG: GyrI-like domain-containing protein [Pseudomonadota bacterium]